MGTVVQLKNKINNSYLDLKSSVEDKLVLVEERIKTKLISKVDLVEKMTKYHLDTGGKRLRALLTCLLYTSPSPRDLLGSRMPSSA